MGTSKIKYPWCLIPEWAPPLLPLFSFCLWMCFAAGAVPMWLKLQKVIKELQEEKKVSGDRLFLVWINRKTTRERFLPPVSMAMSFIPMWKSFELMYIHRRRRKKIYSDHVTKTIPHSWLRIPAKKYLAGASRLPSSWISKFIDQHPRLLSFLSQIIVIPPCCCGFLPLWIT